MIFQLHPLAPGDLDRAIAALPELRLIRAGRALFVDADAQWAHRLVREMAFAGLRAEPSADPTERRAGLLPGSGGRLQRVPDGVALDVLYLRPLGLAEATRRVRPRIAWPDGGERLRRCRDLLHGRDAIVAWDRRAWATRGAWKRGEVRRVLRPAIFDRAAPLSYRGRTWVREGAIARWAFG